MASNTRRISFRTEDALNMILGPEKAACCRDRFATLDPHNRGYINRSDVRNLLEHIGEDVTDEKLTGLFAFMDEENIRRVDASALMKLCTKLKELNQIEEDDTDVDVCKRQTVNAFVAMGGNWDKTGAVKKSWIQKILVDVFGMVKVNIEKLLEEAGLDVEDDLSFEDFNIFLTAGTPERASRIRSLFSLVSSQA